MSVEYPIYFALLPDVPLEPSEPFTPDTPLVPELAAVYCVPFMYKSPDVIYNEPVTF